MAEVLMHIFSAGIDAGAVAGYTPQTALAAVLCATLMGLFS